jgi:ABC-2 type transport system ATP-binding protein
MIEVNGLTKRYGVREAVSSVSFHVGAGEIVGFLGPNGAGKTTTLRMLTTYLPPTAGTARVAGYDVETQSMEVRARIGYLPESVALYRDLTVRAYLDLVATLKGMSRNQQRRRAEEVVDACGIRDVYARRIGTLSRGYRQRVGLAQALINDPDVLFLDEPTVGLDPRQIVEIRELIRSLAGKRTVMLSTHILPEVNLLCRRVLIIHRGRLVSDGPPRELAAHAGGPARVELEVRAGREALAQALAEIPALSGYEIETAADGVCRARVVGRDGADPREAVAEALVRRGLGLLSMSVTAATLEDIFLHLVTRED